MSGDGWGEGADTRALLPRHHLALEARRRRSGTLAKLVDRWRPSGFNVLKAFANIKPGA